MEYVEAPDSLPYAHDFTFIDVDRVFNGRSQNGAFDIPPLIAFGYFEHHRSVPTSWRSPVFGQVSARQGAYRHLFRTGNEKPPTPFSLMPQSLQPAPDPFGDPDWLSTVRATREFRACLWIHHGTLDSSPPARLNFSWAAQVGYTPPARPPKSRALPEYIDGEGLTGKPEVAWTPDYVQLSAAIQFRIATWTAKLGSPMLMLSGIPYMVMTLRLRIDRVGAACVDFNGSIVPNQVYQKGSAVAEVSMVNGVAYSNILKAIQSGGKRQAPIHYTTSM
jgi:hypothetical protein